MPVDAYRVSVLILICSWFDLALVLFGCVLSVSGSRNSDVEQRTKILVDLNTRGERINPSPFIFLRDRF